MAAAPPPATAITTTRTGLPLELGPSDDRRYVEQLFKAIFQAGLSWPVVESHWPAFSEVFHGFHPVRVAAMTEEEIDRAEHNTQIIRNHRKIHEAVESAAAVNEVVAQHGSLDAYLRSFGSPEEEITDLKRRVRRARRLLGLVVHGLGGAAAPARHLVGDFSAWWFMQSVGRPVPPTGG